jgi:5-methylcytosine-specific restriction enzyme subunit McrC
MSNTRPIIQVFEHHWLKVNEHPTFTQAHFNALEKYGYKTKEKYYSVGNRRIKFNSYVGVIQVNNLTIEVLPKADNHTANDASKERWHNALITMLNECKLIKLNAISTAKLKLHSASILDLYYDYFLAEVETIYKHGLRKDYRTIQENLNKVKGKILFTNHLKKNAIHQERFFVEHKIFDANNRLNQILFKALIILKNIAHNPKHFIRINKLLLNFEGISEKNVDSLWFENLRHDRNTERYKAAVNLAKLIILRYNPDMKGGPENVLSIMFDMNLLFENYIFRKLKAVQADPDNPILSIRDQTRTPFWESRGLRADILVESEDKCIVIDTKWKVLKRNTPNDPDLKQMFVYNLHYDTDLSILLYPMTDVKSSQKKAYRNEKFMHHHCQVAFIDIFDEDGILERNLGIKIYEKFLRNELSLGALGHVSKG